MSKNELATLIAPPNNPKPSGYKAGESPSEEVRLEAIISVAELMEKGTRSTTAIMVMLKDNYGLATRDTAIKYRNLAAMLMQREHKPLNREAWRAMEIGRLNWWIERLSSRIKDYEEARPGIHSEDYLKWNDTYAKLIGKLNDFGARLHAITGLNEITVNSNERKSRVVFHFDATNKPKSHNVPIPGSVTEGTVIGHAHTNESQPHRTTTD